MFINYFAYSVRRAGWLLALLWLSHSALASSPSVRLEGGPSELRENIRHFLTIAEEPCATPQWRLRALLRDVDRQIQSAAQALGYYHVESTKELSRDDDCWALDITLDPGEPMLISAVEVRIEGEGEDDPAFVSLRRNPGVREGERLNHGRYESYKNRFGAIASSRGYFDARFERARINVNRSENTARIELHYITGPRYRFGEITLSHDILGEPLLKRYLTFEPGDPYDTDKLMELKSLYNASDYFQNARVAPRLQSLSGEEVPVEIELEGRKRRSYSVGAGYATDTGPRILFGYEDRYVNDRGHSWKAETRLSEVKSTLETVYSIPMTRPAYESVQLVAGVEREDTRVAISDRYTVGTRYTRWQDNQWLQTYSINYEMENFVIGSEPRQRSHLLIPAFAMSRTKADGSNYPTEGWSLMGRISGSPETFGSDFSFLQVMGRAKYIQSVGTGRLLLRAEGGATAMDEFDRLPPSVRFFAGGDASVRGYSYKSLGPTNDEGEVIGGNHMLVGSVEYDYRFRPSWAAAVFMDAGNAFNDSDFTVKRSAGVGVRWISPIGPIRVDVARALDDEGGWQLHLSMGPDL
ncbi:autotransporter assembly complex protein TamA [Marinimicrobium alkaliphilum]|uniref:autotransporter assembly complex protein TamA n=1 Tax=Marinimicrobium alkaliphilum TaxID=2202654 RepID=UPI001E562998|nr:autotransporter assembly complex family protein [Marinimicrobium alkaliphilum]